MGAGRRLDEAGRAPPPPGSADSTKEHHHDHHLPPPPAPRGGHRARGRSGHRRHRLCSIRPGGSGRGVGRGHRGLLDGRPEGSAGLGEARPQAVLSCSEGLLPHAGAKVTVKLTADEVGSDRFQIRARGLQPRTPYTVFLLEKAGSPFGAAEYIGDFTTNRHGRADNTYNLIVEEAFAFNNETRDRTDLNSVGVWFADPADDDDCLGSGSPVTGFDGDAAAGVQMLNSRAHLLP
jgi:hypothetical protein